MPTAVEANGIVGCEDLQEVRVELVRADRGEPAQARQAIVFLMDQAVIPALVARLKYLLQMIDDLFVREFREPA
jgi:hypothetical protein